MFDQILLNLLNQKQDYLRLKYQVSKTPLEKSVNDILQQIEDYIIKIARLDDTKNKIIHKFDEN